jgi:hypothetical protein
MRGGVIPCRFGLPQVEAPGSCWQRLRRLQLLTFLDESLVEPT